MPGLRTWSRHLGDDASRCARTNSNTTTCEGGGPLCRPHQALEDRDRRQDARRGDDDGLGSRHPGQRQGEAKASQGGRGPGGGSGSCRRQRQPGSRSTKPSATRSSTRSTAHRGQVRRRGVPDPLGPRHPRGRRQGSDGARRPSSALAPRRPLTIGRGPLRRPRVRGSDDRATPGPYSQDRGPLVLRQAAPHAGVRAPRAITTAPLSTGHVARWPLAAPARAPTRRPTLALGVTRRSSRRRGRRLRTATPTGPSLVREISAMRLLSRFLSPWAVGSSALGGSVVRAPARRVVMAERYNRARSCSRLGMASARSRMTRLRRRPGRLTRSGSAPPSPHDDPRRTGTIASAPADEDVSTPTTTAPDAERLRSLSRPSRAGSVWRPRRSARGTGGTGSVRRIPARAPPVQRDRCQSGIACSRRVHSTASRLARRRGLAPATDAAEHGHRVRPVAPHPDSLTAVVDAAPADDVRTAALASRSATWDTGCGRPLADRTPRRARADLLAWRTVVDRPGASTPRSRSGRPRPPRCATRRGRPACRGQPCRACPRAP